jgi:hypothetical protein
LHAALPHRVDGRDATGVTPRSTTTAAWGDPPVVLRCGVGRPRGFTATSEVVEVDGVSWFLRETRTGYLFTAVGRRAFVEVRVPSAVPRAEATAPLVDLAAAVRRSDPAATT